jgi:hypothetical protein
MGAVLLSTVCATIGVPPVFFPPFIRTFIFCSTRKQRGNCDPILVTVNLYRILQLDGFAFCPFTPTVTCPIGVGLCLLPSKTTLFFRSTRNERGNCDPILVAVLLYCTSQLDGFAFCPFTRTSIRRVNVGIQETVPSMRALNPFDQAPVRQLSPKFCHRAFLLNLQLAIFICCPGSLASIRCADVGIQDIFPSVPTLSSRSTRNERGNGNPI